MNRRAVILSILGLGAATFGGAAWYVTRPAPFAKIEAQTEPPMPAKQPEALMRSYSPSFGPEDAPVTIVEFFDPACEACRSFDPIVKDIMAEHGDAVRVIIRYTAFHGEASVEAIRVLEAARMQGVFRQVMDALLREQPNWASHGAPAPGLLLDIAGSAGLDVNAARTQMLAPGVVAILNQDSADVEAMGVRQTPTFFVNGRLLDPFGEVELRRRVAAEVAATQR
ncbi:thioredoxin domain-containing protein [Martelella mediterranea]|uniref:DsbA family protein n=1 Tax=Martelella mediterranea TaxID=293089 RepID=UPI000C550E18|nr:thioredoxin domain-containing protein [Martelella mediterranea]MAZ83762.1 disulfide bond formation protein DsbA [Hoeflea sp.]MBA67258.1 disulfide bond formation protein DsbA [Hyphomicrobiales bacterium]MCD1636736.1 thioredoxin domain-containing protein [Martelella mediterranea]|tara:strand:- start:7020 stop:7694 length:675 start_codon:yes stop_codon:yes gene_type:complete